jgi:hypothetical protein
MGLGIGDYDNNGWLDLAFSNINTPRVLLRNLGDGTFGDVSIPSGLQTPSDRVTWGTVFFDHDNDKWQDLLFVAGRIAPVGQPNLFYRNNGDGTFTDISAESGLDNPGRGRSASIADFDGDGHVDVFVGNYGGAPALLHNQSVKLGNTNNWLVITVEGTVSNRDAIGTRIEAKTGGMLLTRQITSGPTHGGGDQKAAFFGLGGAGGAKVRVIWPSGVIQNLGIVSANQRLHLVEPGAAEAPATTEEKPQGTVVEPNFPNPFNPETWIPYQLAEAALVRLSIYDIKGAHVKTIEVGHQAAGVYRSKAKAIYWDGRNEQGERVASGVYFYRFQAGDYSATRRMLILK